MGGEISRGADAEKQADHLTLGPDGIHYLKAGGEVVGREAKEHGRRHGGDGGRAKAVAANAAAAAAAAAKARAVQKAVKKKA